MSDSRGGLPRDPRGCSRARRSASRQAGTDFQANYITGQEPTDAVRVPQYTATARQALSAQPGWHVYDTDANKPLWYDGADWRDGAGTIVP